MHTSKLSSFTKTSPFGVTNGTCSNLTHQHNNDILNMLTSISHKYIYRIFTHQCSNNNSNNTIRPLSAPAYLADDCRWIRHRRAGLRSSSDMMKLDVPSTRTTFGDRSFAVNGPRVWNSLPASIRDPSLSLTVFRNSLKTHLFVQ